MAIVCLAGTSFWQAHINSLIGKMITMQQQAILAQRETIANLEQRVRLLEQHD